jgi:hypothetical protein
MGRAEPPIKEVSAGFSLADLFQAELAVVLLGNPVALAGGDKGGPVLGASFDGTLSVVRIELTTVVVGSRSGLCPSSRRVALWLLPSSERISAAVRA